MDAGNKEEREGKWSYFHRRNNFNLINHETHNSDLRDFQEHVQEHINKLVWYEGFLHGRVGNIWLETDKLTEASSFGCLISAHLTYLETIKQLV